MVLPESGLLRVRDDVATEAAALTEPFAIAVHAVKHARLTAAKEIVVIGCGPIGLAIIALVALRKTHRIVASDPSSARRDMAHGLAQTSPSIRVSRHRFHNYARAVLRRSLSVSERQD